MNVSDLSNPFPVVAHRTTPLTDAARLMREHHVGSLVVVDESGRGCVPVGMLTDRDIVVAVVAGEVDPRTLSVGEVMTGELATVPAGDSAEAALRLRRSRGIRRLPVVSEAGMLTGIVTLDDLLEKVAGQLSDAVRAIASEKVHEAHARK
jgi:CBS domain-containing protein